MPSVEATQLLAKQDCNCSIVLLYEGQNEKLKFSSLRKMEDNFESQAEAAHKFEAQVSDTTMML